MTNQSQEAEYINETIAHGQRILDAWENPQMHLLSPGRGPSDWSAVRGVLLCVFR